MERHDDDSEQYARMTDEQFESFIEHNPMASMVLNQYYNMDCIQQHNRFKLMYDASRWINHDFKNQKESV
jgi:hypothetical protein